MLRFLCITLIISAYVTICSSVSMAERPYVATWVVQIGSPEKDEATGIIMGPDGMLYLAGTTSGKMYSCDRFGNCDIFMSKIGLDGKLYWTRQYGTGRFDKAMGFLNNSRDLSVIGVTDGLFANKKRLVVEAEKDEQGSSPYEPFNDPGYMDIFVIDIDLDGFMIGDRQSETKLDKIPEQVAAARWVLSEGQLYGGRGEGKDLLENAKYNGKKVSGIHSYTRFITDDGNFVGRVIIPDVNDEEDNNYDAFASRGYNEFTRYGTNMWDEAVVATNGLRYIAGITKGDFDDEPNMGGWDAFILKNGNNGQEWSKMVGTDKTEQVKDIKTDDKDNVYLIGETDGSLRDCVNTGDTDIFIVKFDREGNELWHRQIGTVMADTAVSAFIGADDALYLTGHTEGSFPGCFNYGGEDVFVMRLEPDRNAPPDVMPADQDYFGRETSSEGIRPTFTNRGILLADKVITEDGAGEEQVVNVGDVVVFRLTRSNIPGRNWGLDKYDRSSLEKLDISYGKGAYKTLAFGALSAGKTTVTFHNSTEELHFDLKIVVE